MSPPADGLVYPKKGTLDTSSNGMHKWDAMDSAGPSPSPGNSDFRLKALGGVKRWESSTPSSPASPSTPSGRSRSPFARAARRAAATSSAAGASASSGSRTTSPRHRRPASTTTRSKQPAGPSVAETLDELSADFGDFLDKNFLEILYGIAIAMLLVVLVTSCIARAYIPPYKGWDSERAIYVAASWYSGAALALMIVLPLFGPMLYNGFIEFQKVSEKNTCKQKAALRAFRKGWKTGVVFYDRIGDRARSLLGLPPMQIVSRAGTANVENKTFLGISNVVTWDHLSIFQEPISTVMEEHLLAKFTTN